MKEIERKFLVRDIKLHSRSPIVILNILQGYVPTSGAPEIRVRRTGGPTSTEWKLTIKTEISHGVREEKEFAIAEDLFVELYYLSSTLRKVRWLIDERGLTFSVDFYKDRHEGLVVAEIEFKSEEEMRNFDPARHPFLGEELTGRKEYSNAFLARGK